MMLSPPKLHITNGKPALAHWIGGVETEVG